MRRIVGNISRIVAGKKPQIDLRGNPVRQLGIPLHLIVNLPDGGLHPGGIPLCRGERGQVLYLGRQVRLHSGQPQQAPPAAALNHYAHTVFRQAKNLLYISHSADGIQVALGGIFHRKLFLGNKEYLTVLSHGLFQGLDGCGAAHVKMKSELREYCKSPKGQHWNGHRHSFDRCHFGSLLPVQLPVIR